MKICVDYDELYPYYYFYEGSPSPYSGFEIEVDEEEYARWLKFEKEFELWQDRLQIRCEAAKRIRKEEERKKLPVFKENNSGFEDCKL